MRRETFDQTIQITMEYNERDVSDDEQIVEEDKYDEDNNMKIQRMNQRRKKMKKKIRG